MAFIGIRVEPQVARLFRDLDVPGDKVAENEYHITLLCFEDEWPVKEIAKAMEAAYEAVQESEPLHIKIDTITCFPKREDNPCPVIGKVESKDIHELQKKLKKSFDKHDVEYSKTFKDFKPHVTLAYADDEVKEESIKAIEFFVHEIVLWGGDEGDDRIFITFPLKNSSGKKNAYLLQKIDVFHKLSKKDPNSTLTKSVERRSTER